FDDLAVLGEVVNPRPRVNDEVEVAVAHRSGRQSLAVETVRIEVREVEAESVGLADAAWSEGCGFGLLETRRQGEAIDHELHRVTRGHRRPEHGGPGALRSRKRFAVRQPFQEGDALEGHAINRPHGVLSNADCAPGNLRIDGKAADRRLRRADETVWRAGGGPAGQRGESAW